jgi:hypothetical protein
MTDYGSTPSGTLANETGSLIAASKVEGTSVYNGKASPSARSST